MRRVRPLLATSLVVATLAVVGAVAALDGPVASAASPTPPTSPSADVGLTFRAVGTPGPCLVVEGPGTIRFGQGELGGPPLTAPAGTTVRACEADAAELAVLASVSATTAGGSKVWRPVACVATPCRLAIDEFAYLVGPTSLTDRPVAVSVGVEQRHTLQLPPPGSAGGGSRVIIRVQFLGVGA